jgi:hypothetical protein
MPSYGICFGEAVNQIGPYLNAAERIFYISVIRKLTTLCVIRRWPGQLVPF